LAANLRHADYVSIVCGSLDGLASAFAELDADNRSRSIAAATAITTTIETASLSTLDKQLVRKPALATALLPRLRVSKLGQPVRFHENILSATDV
jgi:hypothetical protein